MGEPASGGWRRQVRAALVGFALLGHGIYALPLPHRITASELTSGGSEDIDRWYAAVHAVGVPWTRAEFVDKLVEVTAATGAAHGWLKAPFRPIFDLVGANQAWALFASTTTTPERLVVEVRRGANPEWIPILRRMDPCCTWREDQIRYRRIRGVWDSQYTGMRPAYLGLAKWLADQAFAEFSDVREARVRIERGRATLPWQEPDPKTTSVHSRIFRRP